MDSGTWAHMDVLCLSDPRVEIPIDCSVELSPKGYQFFTELFQVFDKVQLGRMDVLGHHLFVLAHISYAVLHPETSSFSNRTKIVR